jgi:hypothetical protein
MMGALFGWAYLRICYVSSAEVVATAVKLTESIRDGCCNVQCADRAHHVTGTGTVARVSIWRTQRWRKESRS